MENIFMSEMKEPKHLKVFRIVGFSMLGLGMLLVILGCVLFVRAEGFICFAMIVPGSFLIVGCGLCLFIGFSAKMENMEIEKTKYIQERNKTNLKDIANTSADIASEPLTKVTKSIKAGLKETKYCKHCGAQIDFDSKFCKNCGKEQ